VWVQRTDAAGGHGDWILAGEGDQSASRGGLRAEASLHTATLLALFTDARRPDDVPAIDLDDDDPRGWWGNSIRLDGEPEAELGSLLWTLEWTTLDDRTRLAAEDYARRALAVLIDTGVATDVVVTAEIDQGAGMLGLDVAIYAGRGSTPAYRHRFGLLAAQDARAARFNYGDAGTLI
jgi:phage gp46-like protein